MKKHGVLNSLLAGFVILSSCSGIEDMLVEEQQNQVQQFKSVVQDGVVYPRSENRIESRATYDSGTLNWENETKVQLPDGQFVDYPWIDGGNLPFSMQQKLKKEDGWELIAHTMRPNTENNKAYLVFHNYVTGTLKVFCYMRDFVTNNNGFWKVSFEHSNKLLNFANAYAIPFSNSDGSTDIIVSNSTDAIHKGFAFGWNGFQLELAYDPNAVGKMRIEPYSSTTTDYSLEGDYQELTEGVIVSQTKSATLLSEGLEGIGKLAGNAAGDFITKQAPYIKIPFIKGEDLADMAKKGVTKAFDAFAGLFKKDTKQISDVSLTTNGSIKLQGFAIVHSPVSIGTLNLDLELIEGKLGAWNVETSAVYWYKMGFYDVDANQNNPFMMEYYYKTNGIDRIDVGSIMMNPKLKNVLINSSFDYELVYINGSEMAQPTYTLSNSVGLGLYENVVASQSKLMYQKGNNSVMSLGLNPCLQARVMMNYVDETPMPYVDLTTAKVISSLGVAGIRLKVYPHFTCSIKGVESEYYAAKTYVCNHEWGNYD